MDGRTDGRTVGRSDRKTKGRTVGRSVGRSVGWLVGQKDRRMAGVAKREEGRANKDGWAAGLALVECAELEVRGEMATLDGL